MFIKRSIMLVIIMIFISVSYIWADFPNERGLCLTPWIKEATSDVNWDAVRLNNLRIKMQGQSFLYENRDVQIGDTMTFWAWNLTVMPPLWIQVPATCRAVGDSCYIFVADNQWNINMDQVDVDTVLEHFEHHTLNNPNYGIVQLDVQHFGEIPDEIDNDRHVYIFYSALGSFQGTSFDGYFSAFNQMTEAQAQALGAHSNEVEMFYMTCYPLNPSAPQRLSVLAHELQHMIHWNMDEDEETWVDEGCAEVAMWLYGLPDPISGFTSHPDDNLLVWDQQWTDYIQTYLFMMYLYDHYGEADIIRTLVADTLNCTFGVESALDSMGYSGVSFKEVFVDWTIANFMDDTIYDNGRYGYFNLYIPTFTSTNYGSYPVSNVTTTVNSWGTDYFKFMFGTDLIIDFDGVDNTEFGLSFVMYDPEIDSVIYAALDGANSGSFSFTDFGVNYDLVLMIVSKVKSSGDSSYQFSADAVSTGVAEEPFPSLQTSDFLTSIYFDHVNSSVNISFFIPVSGNLGISVFDVLGREIYSREYFIPNANSYEFQFDTNQWSNGIYWIRADYNGMNASGKFMIIR